MTRREARAIMYRVFRCLRQGAEFPAVMPAAIRYATLAVQRLHENYFFTEAARISAKIIDNKVK